jgi:NAD(P)-dependent dehydrogenase (short-subunit alcohol dehydrogenase family)
MRLTGKTAIITGAGTGIGRSAAKLFAQEGAAVAVAELDSSTGAAVAGEIKREGGRAIFLKTDVTDSQSVCSTIAEVVRVFGRVDILYNNAGGSTEDDNVVTEASDDAFWRTIRVDLFGTWLCCKHVIPEMIRTGGGAIINTSSLVAAVAWPGKDAYTAAKGAISALTRSIAIQYAPQGIRVNAIAPGVTLSERVAKRIHEGVLSEERLRRQALGYLDPSQVARAALFLASDESSGMTGHVMAVDGGYVVS